MQSQTIRRVTSTQTAFSLHSHATRHLAAHSSRPWLRLLYPRLALFLSLMLFAGLPACGPASSDNAPSLGPRASAGGLGVSKHTASPTAIPLTPITPAVSPVPLAPRNDPGAVAGTGTVPVENSPPAVPVSSTKSVAVLEPLVVPAWIAKDLESPDVGTRVRALETWAQSAPPGAVDPLILALENTDERVRARAMGLIEQDWARTADAEQ